MVFQGAADGREMDINDVVNIGSIATGHGDCDGQIMAGAELKNHFVTLPKACFRNIQLSQTVTCLGICSGEVKNQIGFKLLLNRLQALH